METTTLSLAYPIGRYQAPEEMDTVFIQKSIQEVETLPRLLREAVTGLSDEQLDTPYRPEGWTVRQVVHHIPDSHLHAYIRFKLTLTEDKPAIKPYVEAEWAKLPDSQAGIAVSLKLLEAVHERWSLVLKAMAPEDWNKEYYHPEHQKYISLASALGQYSWHGRHHLAHITHLKARMEW